MLCSRVPQGLARHDATRCQRRKSVSVPKPVNFRKFIDGLAALVEVDIKVAVLDPVLFIFLNKSHLRGKPMDMLSANHF